MSLTMPIPVEMRTEMEQMPYYSFCARREALNDHECEGDPLRERVIEWEHAITHGGIRINEIWAIVGLCFLVHRGRLANKEINQWLALCRATEEDFAKYPRNDWRQKRAYLISKYGVPNISNKINY